MIKNLVQEHISEHFIDDFNSDKTYAKSIIEYIEDVIEGDELMLHHIHINDYLKKNQQGIILDELIDFFHLFNSLNIEDKSDFNKSTIIHSINNKLENTNLRINPSKKEFQEHYKKNHLLKIKSFTVDNAFEENQPVIPKTIVNLNTSFLTYYDNRADKELRQLFQSDGWKRRVIPQEFKKKKNLLRSFKYSLVDGIKEIDDCNVSYIVLNKESFKKNDKIKCGEDSSSYLDNINTILFINNYTKKEFNHFHLNSLETINKDFDTKFKHVFSISFNSKRAKNTIWNLILKKDNIRNSITGDLKASFQNHTVLNNEYLKSSWCEVNFFGSESNGFWSTFNEIAETYGLYELVSIKFRNIISLCFSDFIKDYIIKSVFNNVKSNLITVETQNLINELEKDIKEKLKEELEYLLDFIKQSGYLEIIKKSIDLEGIKSSVIISSSAANNDELRSHIMKLLAVPARKIKTWDSKNFGSNKQIVLAYRDIGNYKYHFYPNLFEYDDVDLKGAKLIKFLFYESYNWASYSYNSDLANLLSNSLLIKKYMWNDLIKKIKDSKPIEHKSDFEKEAHYTNSENATEYRIKYFGKNKDSRVDSHDRIIVCNEDDYEVLSAPNFFNDYYGLSDVAVIELTELITELKLPEINFNSPEITDQLALLKIDYEIENLDTIENGGRLWKILLDRKRQEFKDDDVFYEELKELFQRETINIVSQNTFLNVWCNPESDTIRTNLKALKQICIYLKLPEGYFRLVRRFSSDTASLATQSTRIHNELLINLIDSDALKLHNEENYDSLLLQTIDKLSMDLKQDLVLIGFSEAYLSNRLKDVIQGANKIIKAKKQKIEKLIINEPF